MMPEPSADGGVETEAIDSRLWSPWSRAQVPTRANAGTGWLLTQSTEPTDQALRCQFCRFCRFCRFWQPITTRPRPPAGDPGHGPSATTLRSTRERRHERGGDQSPSSLRPPGPVSTWGQHRLWLTLRPATSQEARCPRGWRASCGLSTRLPAATRESTPRAAVQDVPASTLPNAPAPGVVPHRRVGLQPLAVRAVGSRGRRTPRA